MREIQVAGFLDNSLANGEGLRSVLFTSGCNHNCAGCHNEAMQDFNYGDRASIEEIFVRIKNNTPIIRGVTFSGGEPFEQAGNLSKLAMLVKNKELSIWCYTGYTYEYILENLDVNSGWKDLLYNIDVLIDGRFEQDKAEVNLKYKGSTNQRIIDVKKSISLEQVVLFNDI